MTKLKGKNADKKKPAAVTTASVKKEETPALASVLAEPARVLHVAPIEVVHEEVAAKTPVVEERRTISNEERRRLIALAAYYRAQQVGFGKTNPVDDWLLAEREVDAMMENGKTS